MEREGVQRGGEGRGDRRRLCQEVLPYLHRRDRHPHDGGGSSAQDQANHDRKEASYHRPLPVQETEGQSVCQSKETEGYGSLDEDLRAANYKLARDTYKHSYTLASWASQGKVFAKLKNGKTMRIKYVAD